MGIGVGGAEVDHHSHLVVLRGACWCEKLAGGCTDPYPGTRTRPVSWCVRAMEIEVQACLLSVVSMLLCELVEKS